ncbi:uncharacterized protein LOC129782089 [Toxorhynchites rutilus septentrionalis]|uniref:uncharacterized protein LOC129782089 n=1 Tax=Toxorhynchites rutilus septentrionalis TaxID=329112 RepID=UPI002478C4B3|nr:uncharacterized protein LOC129782089 [Toxorhynchites rutilus septentrionalis]
MALSSGGTELSNRRSCATIPIVGANTCRLFIKASPAEMVYGTTLKIPSEFFVDDIEHRTKLNSSPIYVKKMRNLRPKQTAWHGSRNVFFNKDLHSCKYVFVRNDSVRPSLSSPYEGPFEVVSRKDKFFKVNIKGRSVNVSVDRLKPAYTFEEQHPSSLSGPAVTTTTMTPTTRVTRSGRRVFIPLRYR